MIFFKKTFFLFALSILYHILYTGEIMSNVTIRDIAKALNIAPSTVSSCLSGDTSRRISAARIEEVRKKAEEMGYIPNRLASRIFRRNNRKYLGIIVKNDSSMTSSQSLLNYLLEELNRRNKCDFSILYASDKLLKEAVTNGVGLGIRDFIIIGYLRGNDLKEIDFSKLPEVRLYAANYYFDNSDYHNPAVLKKIGFNRDKYYEKLKHFLEKSNCGPITMVKALEQGQAIPDDRNTIFYQVSEIKDLFKFGYEKIAPEVLKKFQQSQCRTLLLRNDSLAIGVMEYLLEKGIKIPQDIAVIGFNNAPFAPYAKVPLSSISLSLEKNAAKLLDHILDQSPLPDVIDQQPTLILRSSVPSDWDFNNFTI